MGTYDRNREDWTLARANIERQLVLFDAAFNAGNESQMMEAARTIAWEGRDMQKTCKQRMKSMEPAQ